MANFCKDCGRPLTEGEVCNCKEVATEQPKTEAPVSPYAEEKTNNQPSKFGLALKNMLPFLSKYLKKPGEAVSIATTGKDIWLACCYAIVYFIAVFAFLAAFVGKVVSSMSFFDVDYPFPQVLLTSVVVSVVLLAVCTLVKFICAKMAKTDEDFLKSFIGTSLHTIMPSIILLVGAVMSLMSVVAGALFLMIAVLVGVFNMIVTAMNVTADVKNTALTWGVYAITIVGIGIAAFIVYKMAGWSVGSVTSNLLGLLF